MAIIKMREFSSTFKIKKVQKSSLMFRLISWLKLLKAIE